MAALKSLYGIITLIVKEELENSKTFFSKGTNYQIGTPAGFFEPSSGGSLDWAKAIAGIKYSVCLELRPASTGTDSGFGFTLPEDRNYF